MTVIEVIKDEGDAIMTKSQKLANLQRVEGIEFINDLTDLLIKEGVCSVRDLASRNPENLSKKFVNISDVTLDYIQALIEGAKKITIEDKKYSIAIERYYTLINRSFKKLLNIFLFSKLPLNWKDAQNVTFSNLISPVNNSWFDIEPKVLNDYNKIYQNMTLIRKRNKIFKKWKTDDDETIQEQIEEMKDKYCNNFVNEIGIEYFKKFYGRDNDTNRKCDYCDITEKQIEILIKNDLITTKRLYSRGEHIEVDQRNPNNGYTKKNIVLCCYWCNNAKSDEFAYHEFKDIIAPKMKEVWQKRLDKINKYKISY